MSTPSKHQVQNLTPEQQHVLAEVELARLRRRERLLRQARTYRGRRWLSLVFFIFAVWLAFVSVDFPYMVVAISILAVVFVLLHLHTAGINQRLDALMDLLDVDRKNANEEESSHEDKAA